MSEIAHFVNPQLDTRFAEYREDEFDGNDMQELHAWRRVRDPNAGLFPPPVAEQPGAAEDPDAEQLGAAEGDGSDWD